jgi:hypothetical protein
MPPRTMAQRSRGSGDGPGGSGNDGTRKRKVDGSDAASSGNEKRLKHAGRKVVQAEDAPPDDEDESKRDEIEPEEDESEGSEPDENLPKVIGSHKSLKKTLVKNLPPMYRLDDIFADMATRALNDMGFESVLDALPVLNIATMCSGTEAPLLALRMLNKSKRARGQAIWRADMK